MINEISSLIERMWLESGYKEIPFSLDKVKLSVKEMIDKNQFVYLENGCLMLGYISEPFFSNEKIACDMILYTAPESRGKGLAKDAIKEFIDWSKDNGARSVTVGQSSGVCFGQFNSIMKELNMSMSGNTYVRYF